jgi:sporulation protein YlmC with PRC-barrel domain
MRIAFAAVLAGSLGAAPIASAQAQTTPAPSTAPSPAPTPAAPPAGSATAPAQPATPMKQMTVSALTDKDLVGAKDNEVGDIERVVESNADKKQHLVISRGGFLGLFETEVLVPLENVAAQGDRIVLRNLTEEQVKALPKYTTDDKAYRELDGSQTVSLSEVK